LYLQAKGPLSMDIMRLTLDLVDSKGLYSNLADYVCAHASISDQDSRTSSCWNGTDVDK